MNTEALFLFLILLLGLVLCSFLGGENIQEGFDYNNVKAMPASSNKHKRKNNNEYDNYNHYNGKRDIIEKYTNYNDAREDRYDNREDIVDNRYNGGRADNREDKYDNREDRYDNREDVYDYREDVYDNRHNDGRVDKREDVYDNREDVVDNRYNGGRIDKREDVYDTREDVVDNRYNGGRADKREDVVDNRYYGPSDGLPPGIPRSQIPAGQEDLYILKSEVVPPVCPACPTSAACPRQEPCPPCPACARCPEPAFECKKVPNYNAIGNDYLPAPVVADFSTFGM